jgi:hypothetical protein
VVCFKEHNAQCRTYQTIGSLALRSKCHWFGYEEQNDLVPACRSIVEEVVRDKGRERLEAEQESMENTFQICHYITPPSTTQHRPQSGIQGTERGMEFHLPQEILRPNVDMIEQYEQKCRVEHSLDNNSTLIATNIHTVFLVSISMTNTVNDNPEVQRFTLESDA